MGSSVSSPPGLKIIAGSYIGDGTSAKKITTGFEPLLVFISPQDEGGSYDSVWIKHFTMGNPSKNIKTDLWEAGHIDLLSDGFEAEDGPGEGNNFVNRDGAIYSYVVIG